ncbi:MAG TPA: FHA domain-containing protein [Thermomicrobiales bacterium]
MIVQRGEDIGRRFDLDNTQLTIGRGADNDLVLNDPMVSRYHAVLKSQGSRYTLIDLGSSNPVVINDQALEPGNPQQLTHRDVVFIGKTVFSFQNRAAGVSSAQPARPLTQPLQQNTDATQMMGRHDADSPTPPPPTRTTPAPIVEDTGERTVIGAMPGVGVASDDNEKTMVGVAVDRATPPPPLFSPPPPPAAVKFDDDDTKGMGIPAPPPPPAFGGVPQGDRMVGAPSNEDEGDLPTQIIPRR